MTIERKTNGYEKYAAPELMARIAQFEEAAEKVFGCAIKKIDEFFYGERLIMTDIILDNGHYGQFNVTANRISFNGHTCTGAEKEWFGALTLNDELHKGGFIK